MSAESWIPWLVPICGFLVVVLLFTWLRLRLQRRRAEAAQEQVQRSDMAAEAAAAALIAEEEVTLRLLRLFQQRAGAVGAEAKLRDERSLVVLRSGEEPLIVPTVQVYQAYVRYPERLEVILEHYVEGLLTALQSPDPSTLPFEQVRWMVMPQVRRLEDGGPVNRVAVPFGHDLEIRFVMESSHRVATVDHPMLERWSISAEDLHELALTNLELRSASIPIMREWIDEQNAIFVFEARDGYDATRILLADLWREVAEQVGGELYIAIPNRDFLVAFSDQDRELFETMQARVLHDFEHEQNPLTWRLFTVTHEGVSPHAFMLH